MFLYFLVFVLFHLHVLLRPIFHITAVSQEKEKCIITYHRVGFSWCAQPILKRSKHNNAAATTAIVHRYREALHNRRKMKMRKNHPPFEVS